MAVISVPKFAIFDSVYAKKEREDGHFLLATAVPSHIDENYPRHIKYIQMAHYLKTINQEQLL